MTQKSTEFYEALEKKRGEPPGLFKVLYGPDRDHGGCPTAAWAR